MKKISSARVLLLALMTTFFVTISYARTTDDKLRKKAPESAVRFVGKENNHFVFDVQFNADAKGHFRITDGEGRILYSEKLTPRAVTKRFKIEYPELGQLHFEWISKDVIEQQAFDIRYRVEEQLIVTPASK